MPRDSGVGGMMMIRRQELFLKILLSFAVVVCSTGAQASVIIDSFNTTGQHLQDPPGGGFPNSSTIATADAVGGFRTASVVRTSGTANVSLFVSSGALSYSSPASNTGTATILWDANGGGLGGASGFDLTQGSANSVFVVSFLSDL